MKKEPNFLLSPTLGIIKVFSNNLSRLLPIFTVLQRGDERQKYGVIEDSNKKAERFYSPGNMFYMCSSFNNNSEELHLAGLVFTDLSPNNVMVHKTQNQIVFIDTKNLILKWNLKKERQRHITSFIA